MFEFLTGTKTDAIDLIKTDHQNVKDLFDQFERAGTTREKKKIVEEVILELKLHAAVEEEIFYAEVRPQIEKKIMNEADEEHHVAKLLIAELEVMKGSEDHYDAKFKVLSENIRHHIREEESDMLPKARGLSIDYEAMGNQILARKEVLKKYGVPTFAEEKMVAAVHNRGDSPAQNARITKTPAKASAKKPVAKKAMKTEVAKGKSNVIKLSQTAKKLTGKTTKTVKSAARKIVKSASKPAKKRLRASLLPPTHPMAVKQNAALADRNITLSFQRKLRI